MFIKDNTLLPGINQDTKVNNRLTFVKVWCFILRRRMRIEWDLQNLEKEILIDFSVLRHAPNPNSSSEFSNKQYTFWFGAC
jgi:hypothetical protein